VTDRRGVSPVVSTVLLITIAVSMAVLTYVWVSGLVAQVKVGAGDPSPEKIALLSYNFRDLTMLRITLKNVGPRPTTIERVYFEGIAVATMNLALDVYAMSDLSFGPPFSVVAGRAYTLTVTTVAGGKFSFAVIAGRVG